ncbi:acyl-CoA dehydrogenase [Mangrovitalea sediminis]|uniref:acyl-CoA dehydrogenase n=1 Tax=Mangrovitalea sediminis TaxID=1982043 RepID=UPI000BE4BE89|nr:acyl-CoA dehydrogenase [Mangrovitalea sediminis]
MSVLFWLISLLVLIYLGVGEVVLVVLVGLATLAGMYLDGWGMISVILGAVLYGGSAVVIVPSAWRRKSLSAPILDWIKGKLPKLSDTEAEALKSGDVDWDGELFSGKPNWNRLLEYAHPHFSPEEQAFLDGPVEKLCGMLNDWEITHELYDLPESVWTYIRESGFFGLVIPKAFGGMGFSATAHSEIVMKVSSRSVSAAVTVMVPNSLGPGELLLHYGTDEQKKYYLPRLAQGVEVPCFALTSPVAGSDAGAIPDRGVVSRGIWKGEEVLGLKVTWNKRYITLSPVATLIGLAIKVYDPDGLLGDEEDLGVTCVLIPHDTEGVVQGARHLPMNTVFMNGPIWGQDVFIPLDQVIGGQKMIGKGWTMLLESLSVGRSISLPALGTGAGKMSSLTTGAYAAVREQFGRSVSQFEGVQEAMEPIAGYTYLMDAARIFTAGMQDRGVRPAIPSAVLKYRNTELMRTVVNHAMDVIAGRGVISGPRNFLSSVYQAIPIGITVEGANILTRSLMIFGQGAIRCHPFIVDEIEAANMDDREAALRKFDGVFFKHMRHSTRNTLRAFLLGLSHGLLEPVPGKGGLQKYYRQLSRFSAAFAILTDISLVTLGGGLKARERLSGRMADCLIHLYYASAAIKQWHEEGYSEDMRPVVEWGLQTSLHDLQQQMRRLIENYPVKALRRPLKWLVFPLGLRMRLPDDALGRQVALSIVQDGQVRDRLVRGVYITEDPSDAVGRVLHAYRMAQDTKRIRDKLHDAIRKTDPDELQDLEMLLGHQRKELVDWAVERDIVAESDRETLVEALDAMYDVIRVDAFDGKDIEALADASKGKLKEIARP